MKFVKQVLGGDLSRYTMVIVLVALLVVFNIMTGGLMLTSANIFGLLFANTYVFILAMGMLMVIVMGHIDLAVGSVAGFTGMVCAITWNKGDGTPWWLSILIGLAIGAAVGAWQGFWLAKVGIPGFVTTLAGWMIFRGATIWISNAVSRPEPTQLRTLGSGYLPDWGREAFGLNMATVVIGALGIVALSYTQLRSRTKLMAVTGEHEPLAPVVTRIVLFSAIIAFFTYIMASGNKGTSLPIPTIIVAVLVLFYSTLTQRTSFGRHVYAVGGNKAAAALTGISVPRVYFLTMFNMSILAAIAGLLMAGRGTAAGPNDGNAWELDAIASVFIGGAAVTGGIGTVGATIIGALVMASINSGLSLMGVGADKVQVIKGLVLLAAVALDVFNRRQGKTSITGMLFKKKTPEVEGAPAAKTA